LTPVAIKDVHDITPWSAVAALQALAARMCSASVARVRSEIRSPEKTHG
jgi:hypothetical protein